MSISFLVGVSTGAFCAFAFMALLMFLKIIDKLFNN